MSALTKIKGIGPALAAACAAKGFKTVAKIASASPEEFAAVPGVSVARAEVFIATAKSLLPEKAAAADRSKPSASSEDAGKKKKKKDKKKKKGKKKRGCPS